MPVQIGTGVGEWPSTIQHISNGEPADQTTFRRPSVDLENRTLALLTFVEAQEELRDTQVTALDTFNNTHNHDGLNSVLMDLQQAYENSGASAFIQLEELGSLIIRANNNDTLLAFDDSTKKITGTGAVQASVLDLDDITMDTFSAGTIKAAVTLTQETSWDDHVADTPGNPHNHSLVGQPLSMMTMAALGESDVVSLALVGETAGANTATEGVVTDSPYNKVVIKDENNATITNGSGSAVYGRISEDGGVWTLRYYSLVTGSETPYTFSSATDINWWVQKIYSPINRPVYTPMMDVMIFI